MKDFLKVFAVGLLIIMIGSGIFYGGYSLLWKPTQPIAYDDFPLEPSRSSRPPVPTTKIEEDEVTGSNNIFIGYQAAGVAVETGDNNVMIGCFEVCK